MSYYKIIARDPKRECNHQNQRCHWVGAHEDLEYHKLRVELMYLLPIKVHQVTKEEYEQRRSQ